MKKWLTQLEQYLSGAGYIGNFFNLYDQQPKDGYEYASILGVLIAPSSRGNVTLKSADTDDLPIVNPNLLGTKEDQEVIVATFKRMRQAFQSDAMAPVVIGEEYNPGTQVQTDEEILEFIKNNVMTLWHSACTCKMGTSDDPMAVVDNESRVLGVSGLRVVDASAFPLLPPGHPQSTVCKSSYPVFVGLVLMRNRHVGGEDLGSYYQVWKTAVMVSVTWWTFALGPLCEYIRAVRT